MIRKIPVIGVMGSGSQEHGQKSEILGKWIASEGYHLLTGAGSGIMEAVGRAFCQVKKRAGISIGIVPGNFEKNEYSALAGYPNQYVELPVFTHLPLSGKNGTSVQSRNHINILTSDVIIVLPGKYGTASEVLLALKYKKPLFGFFKSIDSVTGLKKHIEHSDNFEDVKSFIKRNLS